MTLKHIVAFYLSAMSPSALPAQRLTADALPAPGTRVRVRTSPPAARHAVLVGTLDRTGADSIVIAESRGSVHRVPLADVTHLELSRGRRRVVSALRGFGLGVLSGAAFGAGIGYLVSPEYRGGDCPTICGKTAGAVVGGMLGIVLGGGAGAVLGTSRGPERWERRWISPTSSWTPHPWSVGVDVGRAMINQRASTGNVYGFRVIRDVGDAGRARVGVAYAHASLPSDFNTVDIAVEVIPLSRSILTPTLAVGGGTIYDHTSFDLFGLASAGLELRVHPRFRLRGAQQWGTHREQQRWNVGPKMTTIGAIFRLGPGA